MAASWSLSHTLGEKEKTFYWRIDSRGNIFIKRKFRKDIFSRIDKISCNNLDRLQEFMQEREWKGLASNASKLYTGTEKNGIGKFMYSLRPEVPYAQLSSQLAAIFYRSEVWEWNRKKRGMKFLLLSGSWQEKTAQYYRNSLISERKLPEPENQDCFISDFFKNSLQQENELKKLQELKRLQEPLQKTIQEEPAQKIVQTKLSAFFGS